MATRKNRLQLLLSDLELEALKRYAETKQLSISEVLRDYIKSLQSDGR
jgi:hypothetical protein